MSIGIIIVFTSLTLLVMFIFMLLGNLNKDHETVGTGIDFLKTPAVPKTIEEILKEALKDPPTGCMWEVKKSIRHYRKLPNGGNVFDGSIDAIFAEIKLITPYGDGRAFSMPIDDEFIERKIAHNAQVSIRQYKEKLIEIENFNKKINDEWDGVYS